MLSLRLAVGEPELNYLHRIRRHLLFSEFEKVKHVFFPGHKAVDVSVTQDASVVTFGFVSCNTFYFSAPLFTFLSARLVDVPING